VHPPIDTKRLDNNPIIHPALDDSLGDNINGPSLIRAPAWLDNPLGRYYLYFAHHDGDHIRLAYSDALEGPWRIYPGGVLSLERAGFKGHIASPDVHVDEKARRIRMYFHGADAGSEANPPQETRLALSDTGLSFSAEPENLGPAYFRVFHWQQCVYALAMPGVIYRSADGQSRFEQGPDLGTSNMRHSAVRVNGERLDVFYSNIGDCPEAILYSSIDLKADWSGWRLPSPSPVIAPEFDYEGANQPLLASVVGMARQPMHQLRDPAVFSDGGRDYLLYSVAGERGIAIAEVTGRR